MTQLGDLAHTDGMQKQQRAGADSERLTLRIPADAAKRVRLKAIEDRSSLASVVTAIIYDTLDSRGRLIDRRKGAAA